MKIILNKCYGGFRISEKAKELFEERTGHAFSKIRMQRTNEILIQIVEEIGEKASTSVSDLHVITVPDGYTYWHITDYDGFESAVVSKTPIQFL